MKILMRVTRCNIKKEIMELLWAQEHDRLRRERVFKDRLNPLAVSDAHLLSGCAKASGPIFQDTPTGPTQYVATQALVALRVYASGSFQCDRGLGNSQSSVSRIINAVTDAIFNIGQGGMKMPRRREEIQKIEQDVFAVCGFPNVLRAIDCTHIPIKAPSVHDSYIWNDSILRRHFQEQQFGHSYLLGDSGSPLKTCIMTPLAESRTAAEVRYNSSHACYMLLHNICVKRGILFQDI
ncbi:putative nuclease HARBI1 [Penaeus vannamei]|uniref:putative nuclease HARBI1 n=1 Tax=Penaeus vannamei TaxID=6689 RepID=UPI00387F939C